MAEKPYTVIFHVKKLRDGKEGDITIKVHPAWAPLGARHASIRCAPCTISA